MLQSFYFILVVMAKDLKRIFSIYLPILIIKKEKQQGYEIPNLMSG